MTSLEFVLIHVMLMMPGIDLVNDLSGVFEKFDKVIGTDQIGVFHINDSKNVLGAGKDRHEKYRFWKHWI